MNAFHWLASALLCAAAPDPAAPGESTWRQYATPEDAGWSSERLAAAWELADQSGSAAVFGVFRGHALVAWGEVARRFECHSVRKSVVNALVGQALAQGTLALDATLEELEIDDLQPLTAEEQRARVVDLVRARSGVYHPAAKEPADMRAERPARGSHAAGEFFFYNNWDFNLLGTLCERAAKTPFFEAFRDQIAVPLGMEDFRVQDGFVELAPSYSRYPAHAFRLSARDLARFGQLYLQQGTWNGRELIPPQWVADSTSPHTDLGGGRGYGYLWWTYAAGSTAKYPRLNEFDCFAAIGTGGQFVLVVPKAEFVFVHRGDTDNEREVRGERVWSVAEALLAARDGPPKEKPTLSELRVEPFTDPGPPKPEHAPLALAPESYAGLLGEYAFEQGFTVRTFLHEGRLFVHRNDGDEAELLPLSDSRFTLWFPAYEIEFERDAAGRAVSVALTTPKGRLNGRRIDAAK